MSLKRMIPFLLVNIVVSALVVVGLWTYLQERSPQANVEPVVTIVIQENVNPPVAAVDLLPTTPLDSAPAEAADEAADEALPTPTPAAAATEVRRDAVTHIVQAGELLSNISVQYDISVDEIVVANGLDNPNQIFAGQELLIPANTEAIEEAEAVVATQPPPTAVAADVIATGETALTIANVNGAGDLETEYVEVINTGADAILLEGWTLTDDAGNTYTFGQFTLFGGGSGLKIYTNVGEDGATDLFWGGSVPVWSAGKTVIVRDAAGSIQADFVVP